MWARRAQGLGITCPSPGEGAGGGEAEGVLMPRAGVLASFLRGWGAEGF